MTVKDSVHTIIRHMSDFSVRSNMVAINASISASKLNGGQGAAIHYLAGQIQEMSTLSKEKINELNQLMDEISDLSRLINMTGGQRMLLMKMVTAHTLNLNNIRLETMECFSSNLTLIKDSRINTPKSLELIEKIRISWDGYKTRILAIPPIEAFQLSDKLIDQINRLIALYEQY